MKKISFVFSFKNEENNLEELIKRVDTSVKKLKNYNYELIFVNDYLTFYRIRKNSASSKFSKYNLNWWKRRNQAFDCYDYLCKKNNIVSILTLDRILTKLINFVFNKL